MYSAHKEGKSVVAERFIRILKGKVYKYMTSISKNKYKNLIKKYKNIFPKGCASNWPEEVFVISKIENTVSWTYIINDPNGEKIIGTFYEKELQKANRKEFRIRKVIKKKGNKLYVKWKGYYNSFNSWIDKKDVM